MINIWLFGDSFTTEGHLGGALRNKLNISAESRYDEHYFYNNIYVISGKRYMIRNYSGGSMDMQTIIDFWTKSLCKIKKEDIVIVNLTDFARFRLSLRNDCIYTSPHHPHDSIYELKSYFNYASNGFLTNNRLLENIKDIINSSELEDYCNKTAYERLHDGVKLNYFEIIESLYKLTPTNNKLVWSWNKQYIADFIYDKDRVTNEIIGYWETQYDVYLKTNGESGHKHDAHLSDECNRILAEYFYKKFIDGKI